MKSFSAEILWLAFSLILTSLISSFIFGMSLLTNRLSFHLYDTYFVISSWHFILPLFCFVTFFIYLFKENKKGFSRKLPGYFFIISGLALAVTLTVLIKHFSEFDNAISLATHSSLQIKNLEPDLIENPFLKFITDFFTVIQLGILSLLFYGTYRLGQKNK